nr:PREDICTED: uncharacterized protein LOC109032514 [Bemisia tabaci]
MRRVVHVRVPLMLIFIGYLEFTTVGGADPRIQVNCGKLTVQGYKACEIYHDDSLKNYAGPTEKIFPGLFFGLITYECDHEAGFLTSEFDCERCDFECSEVVTRRENLSRQQETIQFWLGAVLGICSAFLTSYLVYQCLNRMPCLRSDQRNNSHTYNFDASTTTDDVRDGDQTGTRQKNGSRRKTFKSIVTGLLVFKTTSACDVMHVVGPNNISTFCHGSGCGSVTENVTNILTITENQKICVTDNYGETVTLKISKIAIRARYAPAYNTSDYSITDNFHGGSCCETHEECNVEDTVCFNTMAAEIPRELRNNTVETECFTSDQTELPMRCYWIFLKRRKGPLYTVYKRTGLVGRVTFTIQNANSHRWVTVDSYDLPVPLLGSTSITHLDVLGEFPDSLLLFNEGLYYVNGSEINKPKMGMFGDVQIMLDGKGEEIYAKEGEVGFCREDESQPCICECKSPNSKSMIAKFLAKRNDFKQPDRFVRWDPELPEVDTFALLTGGHVRMHFGDADSNEPLRPNGTCKFEFLMSFGCTTCEKSSYLVLKAQNITKEGLMPFQSNCSYGRRTVKCDHEPTKLVLKENYDACHIKLPSGEEFFVKMEYHAFETSSGPNRRSNVTVSFVGYSEAFEHLVTSETFIKAFCTTTVFSIVFCLIVMIVIFIYRSHAHSKVHQEKTLIEL